MLFMNDIDEYLADCLSKTTDPIAMLGSLNRFSFEQPPNGDIALAALEKLPETTTEIRECCKDLRVLGRKEFKHLLRWRLKAREIFGFTTKKSSHSEEAGGEVAEVEPMDEELRIQEELQALKDKESSRRKRERRRENEKKQREIMRMQLHMTAPTDIGLEQAGPNGEGAMFALKSVDKSGAINKIVRGQMATLTETDARRNHDSGIGGSETDEESDSEEDQLDREIESMYLHYQARKSELDAKFRAKKARKEHEDGDWEGFDAERQGSDDESEVEEESDDESVDATPVTSRPLLTSLQKDEKTSGGLSKRAAQFFDQDIFKGIAGLEEDKSTAEDSDVEEIDAGLDELDAMEAANGRHKAATQDVDNDAGSGLDTQSAAKNISDSDESVDEEGFEVVKRPKNESQWEDRDEPRDKHGRLGKCCLKDIAFELR